ncbi:LamG-like jellyroll fold domain-containing protein [Kineosporia babensis]|uniref:Metallophosphoesterase n=1 Tax=Kineosporia babensis TaxID=499548 RepID=A0A9X1NLP0_9ACTN|nr:LamG-like jellyroll fold domain-containing protein [Kineosporia babensis]MCD5316448.1 metallophosphoesterase [Kineosporia babensis]
MTQHEGRLPVSRRTLFRGAVAVPAVGAVAPLVSAPTAAADSISAANFDSAGPRFAIAVLPDTQYLFDADSSDPEPLRATFRYLVSERDDANIAFMTHLGDVTEHGTDHEITLASKTFKLIDGKVPYSVLAGNHDINGSTDDQRGDSPYLQAFGPKRFRGRPTFGGSSPDGYNSYHVIRGGGRQWLILALDWRASDQGLAWAQGVLDAHPKLPVILTTHDLAASDEQGQAALSGHGQRLWDQLINANDQIFLTLNGHYWPSGRTVLTNQAGHPVHAHITNYQDRYYGGAGMIRLYSFDLARNVIDVETFSPWFLDTDPARRSQLGAETIELTGPADRFSVEIDFDERFAAFAGVKAADPVPPAAVLVRGTVAYWRFDQAGLTAAGSDGKALPAGTVARDLTGKGNDLTAAILHNSSADVLSWSAEHHPAQPAHASLRFDGGQNPNRAAVLETAAKAPINSMKFTSGYTIEAYFKLPEKFEGQHAWMGILSWEGRAGDAGKTNGYSEDEAPCSLNLSGERFLQYAVYPSVQNSQPTSWSHALPVGRWMHLAVVNDGKRTIIYIDGSPIARNPTQPSTGIATLGKPFALGGTQSAEKFGQGYYGWLGDVRIVDRALKPKDFMTPAQ